MGGMESLLNLLMLCSLAFLPPREFPDLAIRCMELADAKAEPVEMPRANAYLVEEDKGFRLEDRYSVFDLWRADALRARWTDIDGSRLSLCRIRQKTPGDMDDADRTRADFCDRYAKAVLGPKDLDALDEAVYLLSPVDVEERLRPRRSQRQNLAELWRYSTTNANAFVYAFRPRVETRRTSDWYLVSLVSDDPEAEEKMDAWLDDVSAVKVRENGEPAKGERKAPTEVGLLAEGYRRNVVNYSDWHFTSASNVVVVDNMAGIDRMPFIAALTNMLPIMQAGYRAALPSPLSDSSHVAAVRVFGTREEYLAYVGAGMKWSAALWSPQHRELVTYMPETGAERLLRTVWHEALHQHLDYACSMIQAPAWFNEGHAVLFENTHFDMDGRMVFDPDPRAVMAVKSDPVALAGHLPDLLAMDYPDFYSDNPDERELNYHLAWSVAYFLQVGAPDVRFQPFKNLRIDLMRELVRTRSRSDASRIVLSGEMMKDLVAEWLAFWRRY